MLEKIGLDAYRTLSRPQYTTINKIKDLLATNPSPQIAEIGVGIGATTKGICEVLQNQGILHVFDFQSVVSELKADLSALGHHNVIAYGNTRRHWDSYHWALLNLWLERGKPVFDYVYLDGSHAALHDIAACCLADKLLKVGGILDFDDYEWTYAGSRALASVRHEYMTPEQESAKQVKMVVDAFVKGNPRFEELVAGKMYRKVASA